MEELKGLKERFISIVVLVIILITIWYMLDMAILTFIITFVFYQLLKKIQMRNERLAGITVPNGLVLSTLYIIFILALAFSIVEFAPKLAAQFTAIANIFMNFNTNDVFDVIDPRLAEVISHINFSKYFTKAGEMLATGVTTVGGFGVNLFFAIILSFLMLIEKEKIKRFGERLESSRISYIYKYMMLFGGNFVKTFGQVMKVQVTIAFINTVVSMFVLTMLSFPQIMSLGVMIFILGLIPVAGMIISLVPLCLIGFSIGGVDKVIAVAIMIIVIHTVEAYVLNPKLMSERTELPVCFVFIILLVGEHYLGVWGLLIGVPIFIFLLNALAVDYEGVCKTKKKKTESNSV